MCLGITEYHDEPRFLTTMDFPGSNTCKKHAYIHGKSLTMIELQVALSAAPGKGRGAARRDGFGANTIGSSVFSAFNFWGK
jgi:hypothetical protein